MRTKHEMTVTFRRIVLSFIVLITAIMGYGQGRQFGLTDLSTVLGSGDRTLEVNATYFERPVYKYSELGTRAKWIFGLGHRLQSSLYLNVTRSRSFTYCGPSKEPIVYHKNIEYYYSMSSEWKYSLLSRKSAPVGVAILTTGTFGVEGYKWENKVVVDWETSHHLVAFNFIHAAEWHKVRYTWSDDRFETFTKYRLLAGYMYRFNTRIGVGLEAKLAVRPFEQFNVDSYPDRKLFAGPSGYYVTGRNFFILHLYHQVNIKEERASFLNDKVGGRLLVGMHF